MSDNHNSTNTNNKLAQFSALTELEQRVIILRSANKKWEEIAEIVNAEFKTNYAWRTMQMWIAPSGRLEQAYLEYLDYTAKRALKRAELRAQQATDDAMQVLVEIMKDRLAKGSDRVNAARAVANKFLPDKQMVIQGEQEADLPAELLSEADDIFESEHASNNPTTTKQPAARASKSAPQPSAANQSTSGKAAQKTGK